MKMKSLLGIVLSLSRDIQLKANLLFANIIEIS